MPKGRSTGTGEYIYGYDPQDMAESIASDALKGGAPTLDVNGVRDSRVSTKTDPDAGSEE